MEEIDPPESVPEGMRRFRVMVVDDSATIRNVAARYLKDLGYEVLGCADGFEALSKLAAFNPDLIFTDINMPSLDGYEFIGLTRAAERFGLTPVVVMSSLSGVFDVAKGKLVGCDSYILKPFEQRVLEEAMHKYLGESCFVSSTADTEV